VAQNGLGIISINGLIWPMVVGQLISREWCVLLGPCGRRSKLYPLLSGSFQCVAYGDQFSSQDPGDVLKPIGSRKP
jgi:hypothetical protein